jgi:hypothetical protein
MKILCTDHLVLRIGGTLMGIFFLTIGYLTLTGMDAAGELADPDRVYWYGVTMIIGGVLAIGFAWLESRLDQVYCATPKRWFRRRPYLAEDDSDHATERGPRM